MKDFGHGESTGLEQTVLEKILTGFVPEDLCITSSDKDILRHLAERVSAVAGSVQMQEKCRLWKRHNELEKTQPVILCAPENGWNEMITEAQMKCTGKISRRWEMDIRKELFWAEVMGDDKPVEPYFDIPYTVSADNWGLETLFHKTHGHGSYVWDNPIKDYAKDLNKIHTPTFAIDWKTTDGCVELAKDIFGDILTVRLKGCWWWSLGLTLPAVMLRGLSNIFMDFIEHTDELKELLSIISRGYMQKLGYLEDNNLLSLNNDGTYVYEPVRFQDKCFEDVRTEWGS